jgi:chemotaxis protein methyltransferase CheR
MPEVMPVSPSQKTLFLFNRFMTRTMGLHVRAERLPELVQKIAAAGMDFGYDDPEACMLWLMSAPLSREHLETLARHLTIGETYFLRDPHSYRVLEEQVLPELIAARRKENKSLRIWSAGCSSGEEPYSIAILLSRIIPDLSSWNITLLATDINPVALERGRQGVYGQWSFRDAPPWLMDYFTKRKDGRFEIIPRIRKMVTFNYLNLAEQNYPSLLNNTNAIDIIFCRNVVLYFEQAVMNGVIANFHKSLLYGGWLFVSPTEIAHRSFDGFTCKRFPGSFVFRKGQWDDTGAGLRPGREAPVPKLATTANAAVPPVVSSVVPDYAAGIPLLRSNHGGESAVVVEDRDSVEETVPADRYLEGVALYNKGHYEQAAAEIREFLAAGRNNADALELLAKTYANLGKFAEARKCCEDTLAADKLRAHNHYLMSIILLELGEPAEAAVSLKRTLYVDHDYVLAHFALGNLNRQEGRVRESQRNFNNALRLLEARDPHEVLPEAEGLTAGRLAEIICAMTIQESSENDR